MGHGSQNVTYCQLSSTLENDAKDLHVVQLMPLPPHHFLPH